MKKILSSVAAVALAAALISCGESKDNTYNYSGAQDTVLTIGAPVVTAKAYAGVNYITWSPVAQADHYELIRTGDGVAGDQQKTIAATKATSFADVADTSNVLADGVVYKYTVIAVPANSTTAPVPQRAVYMQSNAGFASVTAYVPAAGTEITAFTDLYTKNFISANYKDADTIAKKAKLTFANDAIGAAHIVASYPATAGYKFGVEYINSTQPEYILRSKVAADLAGLYLENYTANTASVPFPAPGKYKAYLTMKSVCGYYPTPVVYEVGDYEVKELKVTSHTAFTANKWVSDKKVRLTWTPATLVSGSLAPIGNYKLYRTEGSELTKGSTLVAVTDEVKVADAYTNGDSNNTDVVVDADGNASGKNTITKVYYVETEVPANNVEYTYVLVNTADGEYENLGSTTASAYTTRNVKPYALTTTDAPKFVSTDVAHQSAGNLNNIKVKVQKTKVTQSLALSYVKLDEKFNSTKDYTQTVLPADFTACATLANNDETDETFISYDVKAAYGVYLFKLTASEKGFDPQSVYTIVRVDYVGANIDTTKVKLVHVNPSTKGVLQTALAWYTGSAEERALYNFEWVTVTETFSSNSFYANYVTVSTARADLKWEEPASVKAEDWGNADKMWAKYAAAYISNGTNNKTGDDLRYVTYPYSTKDMSKGESKDGVTVRQTVSVKVTLKADATKYAFTDNNTSSYNLFRINY